MPASITTTTVTASIAVKPKPRASWRSVTYITSEDQCIKLKTDYAGFVLRLTRIRFSLYIHQDIGDRQADPGRK